MRSRSPRFILPCAIVIALAACSSNDGDGGASLAASSGPAASAGKTNAPLRAEQVNTSLETMGKPTYRAADDSLNLVIRITNNGPVPLPAGNTSAVALGLLQLVPDPAHPEGKRGLDIRVSLKSDIAPGKSQPVEASVPAQFLVGNRLQAELLQDGVAWFGFDYKQPVLVWGPFARCADGTGLCDSEGTPVGTAP